MTPDRTPAGRSGKDGGQRRVRGAGGGRVSIAGVACYRPGDRPHLYYRLLAYRHRKGEAKGFSWADYRDLIIATHRRVRLARYHHPLRLAQASRMADITSMTSRSTVSASQCVELLTMTFMPSTEERAVIGKVTAAITASRSAAMVILVLVRVW